VTLLTYTL